MVVISQVEHAYSSIKKYINRNLDAIFTLSQNTQSRIAGLDSIRLNSPIAKGHRQIAHSFASFAPDYKSASGMRLSAECTFV